MKHSKLIFLSFLSALGTAVYVALVALIISHGEKIFGKMANFLGPVAFLLLFVLSAAITGALTLGYPAMLYFNGQRSEAVKMFFCNIGWLFLFTLAILTSQILMK